MKKIFAIALAVLMLLSVAAFAEEAAGTAAVMTIDNVEIVTQGQKIGLGDVGATLALDSINGAATILGMVDGGSEPLLTAVAQLVDGSFVFTVDGLDHAYGAELPEQAAEQLGELGAVLPQLLPMLDSLALPPVPAITIPKLDLRGVLAGFATGGDGSEFEIPAEQVNALLDMLIQAISQSGVKVNGIDQVVAALKQVRDSGMSIALRGTIADDAASQTVSADIYLVTNDQVADEAIANLAINTTENHFELVISADMGGGMSELGTVTLVSDPATAELNFEVQFAGMASLAFDLYTEDGLQKVAFNVKAEDQQADLEFGYGQQEGVDVVSLSGSAADVTFDFAVETAMENGVRTGTLSVNATQRGEVTSITGDITMYRGEDLGMSDFTMPADVRSFDQIDQAALTELLNPVVEYIQGHATMAEAA